MAAAPTFAELAGDLDIRLIEASRMFRATPALHTDGLDGARRALVGATDAAARENALRWLESAIAGALAMAEMIEGPRADASNTAKWDASAADHLNIALFSVVKATQDSAMPRDADWPLGVDAGEFCDPSTRGKATCLLRDMWWRAMLWDQQEARKKPGAFLASVGIVGQHIAELAVQQPAPPPEPEPGLMSGIMPPDRPNQMQQLVDKAARDVADITGVDRLLSDPRHLADMKTLNALERAALDPGRLVQIANPSAEHPTTVMTPSGPVRLPPGGAVTVPVGSFVDEQRKPPAAPKAPPLPGTVRPQPTGEELQQAFQLLGGAELLANAETLMQALTISRSTLNSWRGGRTIPRISPSQARVLAAECQRMIADIEKAEAVFRAIVQ